MRVSGFANKVVVLRSDSMGEGNVALGQTILAAFLRTMMQAAERPRAIFCYNAGVKLLTEESPVLAHLQELAGAGVPVQACKTCVDFFNIHAQLRTGEVSSMAQLVEYMESYEIITL